ncbi:DUF2771 domain-containing protein [Corynebacterium rhinophilum]|uniref:DUF2771 domain-containing protein n=1 Tax=Corynebacterium TaxID=1716 RepID=UPI002550104D|nr:MULTISPECIES: DUF2771 domain-containing protein [unclassified Corynebacterium]MDK8453506.1 DUF2771 domain-containing protein [Corynebacterium sp. MSK084]MDK8467402.1 DUF2771 domain-containing protein [Corynebacterium sp. MSK130]MDK8515436.1 DUF2771 domain-containing protein [Corynebacterium sp. MSK123]MDK8548613.1 DUF2771 domain-containing protein [Corynebacterium sp. MSK222]MDK8648675.1 DUF2771 domain-containing protein [Corynebacterium sp. MSK082]
MATRKEARKKSLLQILALIVVVAVIVASVVIFQSWRNSRPGPEPSEIAITASVGDNTKEVTPYLVCEPGTDCPEGDVPQLTVGEDDTLHLEIPGEISNHEWKVLSIYDDPAANDETTHGANETTEVDIPGSVDPIEASTGERPRLMVVEVSSLMIGTDDDGEETPLATVWSLSTMDD